ncbi:Polyamine transporter 4 [Talaromyces pinophilus]|nr:Polyamine transporter 4 [Talaromyces pinophilus]
MSDLEMNEELTEVKSYPGETVGTGSGRNEPRKAINAINWSFGMKLYHTAIPCFLAFLITFSSSVTVPATSALMAEFNVSQTAAILSGTLYMLGLAFGPMIMAPLSEFIGRRWLYLVTSSNIIAFAGGAGAAQNFATHLICRFFCGFLGSAGIAIGAGTILDVWGAGQAGNLARLLFICGPFLGPSLGPLVGAYIMHEYHGDWRWTQWVIALIGGPTWIMIVFMKETSDTRIEHGKEYSGRLGTVKLALSTLYAAVSRSMTILTTEMIALSITLYTGYAYAVIFSYFASASYVYELDYHFTERETGLALISVIIGYILAVVMYMVIESTLYARAVRNAPNGRPAPEHRLYAGMVGSIFVPIGLFWYAWAAHPGGHWAAAVASGIPFGLGAFVLFVGLFPLKLSSIIYLVEAYGAAAAASAIAANGSFRYLLGAVFPLFTIQMYEKLGVHWAGSVFAFLSLALLPIPWLLFKYGHRLRKNSRFITSVPV